MNRATRKRSPQRPRKGKRRSKRSGAWFSLGSLVALVVFGYQWLQQPQGPQPGPNPQPSASQLDRELNTAVIERRLQPSATASAPRPNATPGRSLTAKPTAVAASPVSELRLATWNLSWLSAEDGKGRVKRSATDFARLASYAKRVDADVIAFQEVSSEAAARRVFDPALYEIHISSRHSPQRTGFAYKRHLAVTPHPDYVALDVGGLRYGSDVSIDLGAAELRLLSVHLKSGCFDRALSSRGKACTKLNQQVAYLEAWVDARAADGVKFAVLGDFNRRFFKTPDEEFWAELDDAEPAEADLMSPTQGVRAQCWNGKYPDFIDHLVLSKGLSNALVPASFTEHQYDARDVAQRQVLSDHCPLSARFRF